MSSSPLFSGIFRKKGDRVKRGAPSRTSRDRARQLRLETLESRLAPTVNATLTGNLLTVTYGAVGDTATVTGTITTGSTISVVGTNFASTLFTGVNSITVTGTAASAQALTLTTTVPADTILASGGALSVTGIATTTVNGLINAGTISGDAPTVSVQSGNGATVQSGVFLTGAGGTVTINNGTYTESNILVPLAITITGQSEAGVILAPAIAGSHDVPSSGFGATPSNGFVVQSSNVTIQDLTIDGNANGALPTQSYQCGVITDFNAPAQPFNALTVQNVTVQNVWHAGIEVATQGIGNILTNDTITNASNSDSDATGIALFGSTIVTGCTISNCDNGIGSNTAGALPNPIVAAQGNTLTNDTTGFNLASLDTGSLIGGAGVGNGNTITMNGSGELGILVSFSVGTVTVQGNQITGSATDAGIWLEDNPAGTATSVIGNTITTTSSSNTTAGTGVGIFLFDDPSVTGETQAGPVVATLQGNTISGFVRGIDAEQNFAATPQDLTATIDGNTLSNDTTAIQLVQTNAGATVTATFANTNTISGGTTGLFISGAGVTLVGNTLASATFSGQSGLYIDLENAALGGTTINATAAIFAGNSGATGTLAQNLAVEAKLHHAVDATTLGFVQILTNNVFVTPTGTKTIGNAISVAAAGDTVNIGNGTYTESNILVPLSLTINGQSEAGVIIAPSIAGSHDVPSSGFGATPSNGFVVQSSNVTIQNLTIDGNANPGLATQSFQTGVITDFNSPAQPFNGLTVQNVTVQNVWHAGIEVATQGSGNLIQNDTIVNASNTDVDATGISLFGSATVTGNTVSNSDNGIGANTAGLPNPVVTAQGNTLTNDITGFNLASLDTGSLIGGAAAGNANTITMNGSGEVGILLGFSVGTVMVQGNQITGSATDSGIWLQDNPSTAATTVIGNSITSTNSSHTAPPPGSNSGTGVGIFIFDDPNVTGETTLGPVVATLQTNTVTGFVRGVDVEQNSASPQNLTVTLNSNTLTNDTTGVQLVQTNAGATVTATFQNTNTITGGTTGLFVSGSGVTLVGSTLASTAFSGQSGLYVDLESAALGGTTVNATAATFAGNTGATGTIVQNYAVETKLHHAIDDTTLGFVQIEANTAFVTPTGTKKIANAITVASAGNTVNIQGGTYNEAVNDTKGLNLQVNGTDNVIINSLTGGGNSTVTLNGSGTTLTTGDATSTTYAGTITGAGNLVKTGAGVFTLTGNSTYAGATTVSGGTLAVNGTLATGGTVAVNAGTLAGTGTIQRQITVNSGGTLSPGSAGAGTLTVAGVTFATGSTFAVTINGPTAGTNYTQLVVTAGPVTLGSATLSVTGTGFTPIPAAVVTLIKNTSGTAVSGTFNGEPESTPVTVGNFTGFITYAGNTGNDVTLVASGPLSFTAGVAGTNFTVRQSGKDIQVLEDGAIVDSRPEVAITAITLNGANGVGNSLTVDFGFGGYFTLQGPLTFNGGTNGTDPVTVSGGTLTTLTAAFTGQNTGNLGLYDGLPGSVQVAFNNTTSLAESTTTVGTLTFQLPGNANTVTITDNGDAATSTLSGSGFITTTYKDPTGLLLLTASPGNDSLTLKRTATTNANYVIDGGGGSDTLAVDLSAESAADVFYMTSTAMHSNNLDGGTNAIYYQDTGGNFGGGVSVTLGSGGNRVFLQGTQTGAPTTVNPGSGTNTIVVSSDPDPTKGLLNTFASQLTIAATAGTNLLLVSEAVDQTSDTVWVNSNGLSFDAEKFTLLYSGTFSGIQVAAGTGNDTINVQSQLANTPVSVFNNGGNDVFNVAVTNASQYANLLLDGDFLGTLKVFDQTGGATVKRTLTAPGLGNIQVLYTGGATSTINFQNMPQQFSNDPIQG